MAQIFSQNISSVTTNVAGVYGSSSSNTTFRIGNNGTSSSSTNYITRIKFTTNSDGARKFDFKLSHAYWIPNGSNSTRILTYSNGKVYSTVSSGDKYEITSAFKFVITKNADTISPVATSSSPGTTISNAIASDNCGSGTITIEEASGTLDASGKNCSPENVWAALSGSADVFLAPNTDYYLWFYGDFDMFTYFRLFAMSGYYYHCLATIDTTGKYYSTVSYNANGGSGAPAAQNKTPGVALTLSSTIPTRSGYDFLGWSTSSTATSASYSAGGSYNASNNDVVLYAVWKLKTYTVSYSKNGYGASNMPSSQTKTHGVALTLDSKTPVLSTTSATVTGHTVTLDANGGSCSSTSVQSTKTRNYRFYRWNTKSDGTGTNYQPGGSYTANSAATMYLRRTYTDTNNAVTLPTPTRSGYKFLGWGTSASATSGITGTYTPSAAITLYAIWKPLGTVEIYNTTTSSWEKYQAFVYNSSTSSWELYMPKVYNGSNWNDIYV